MALDNKKAENFSDWYTEVLTKSEFADYSAVSGCLVIRPLGYAIWDKVRSEVGKRFKQIGIKDAYFPLLIPERFLRKEQEHFEGFVPEVAWVTHTGKSKLDERLAVRPTSEVIMYDSYNRWVRSWRDLPLKLNQWNNVVRWEFKHPTPFLRSREFLWNEGHNVYATAKEVDEDRDKVLKIYTDVQEQFMALPGLVGKKTDKEKFAGGVASYSVEHIMPDGKALQGPDYHDDGQNFAKVFDIKFIDKDEKSKFAYQSTYAISTRQLGALIAAHGDDKGLVLPPKVAPIQVVIVPIFSKKDKKKILSEASKLKNKLDKEGISNQLDGREGHSPGWKFNEWELKGVPVRIEIGPKDLEKKQVVLVRRDSGDKKAVKASNLSKEVAGLLDKIQDNLFKKAKKFLNARITEVKTYDEFKKVLDSKKGFLLAPWCEDRRCEDAIKDETGAKVTNMPMKQGKVTGKCIKCGKSAKKLARFAKSY
jgi:prolyl-tRNA synthetase